MPRLILIALHGSRLWFFQQVCAATIYIQLRRLPGRRVITLVELAVRFSLSDGKRLLFFE